MTGERFETLDLMRGVAALAVVLLHVRPGASALLPHAYLAVDLFFALSGFVLAHAYGERLRAGGGAGRFLAERLIRLYPLYLLATLLGSVLILDAVLAPGVPARSPELWSLGLLANLLFLPAPPGNIGLESHLFPAVFPAWSLFWELVANLIFALIAPRLGGRMLAAVLAIGLALLVATAALRGTLDGGVSWATGWVGGGRVLWSFFAGVALYRLHQQFPVRPALPGWLAGLVLAIAFAAPLMGPAYDLSLAIVVLPLLVFAAAPSRSAIGVWLGGISYAAYVLHAPLINLLDKLARSLAHQPLEALRLPFVAVVVLAATIAAAAIAERRYDRPARAMLRRLLLEPRAAAKPTTKRPAAQ